MPRVPAYAALLLLALACGPEGPPPLPAATAKCEAAELQQLQSGLHLIGEREPPVAYSSVPPTSGWHSSGPPPAGVAAEPLTEPQQVAVLESGGVVAAHGPLEGDGRGELQELAAEHDGQLTVTAYDKLDEGVVVLTSWGVLQRCEGVDREAITAFVEAYGNMEQADH